MPELLEIGDLFDQAGVRAACLFRQPGARMPGEAAHVHLVDDGPRGRPLQRGVALPVVGGESTTTLFIAVAVLSPGRRAASRLYPREPRRLGRRDRGALGGIEAHPARGIERALDPIAVQLARVARPARTRASSGRCGWPQDRAESRARAGIVDAVEQQQLDAGGAPREDAEVDAAGDGVAPRGELPPSPTRRRVTALPSSCSRRRDDPVRLEAELLSAAP